MEVAFYQNWLKYAKALGILNEEYAKIIGIATLGFLLNRKSVIESLAQLMMIPYTRIPTKSSILVMVYSGIISHLKFIQTNYFIAVIE